MLRAWRPEGLNIKSISLLSTILQIRRSAVNYLSDVRNHDLKAGILPLPMP